MKNLTLLTTIATLFIVSCSTKSGKRVTGPKTFITTKIISVRPSVNLKERSAFILIDSNKDGIGDSELCNYSKKEIKSGDSVTLVVQNGIVTSFYPLQ